MPTIKEIKIKRLKIGMNMKMYGRNIQKFKCKRCLLKDLELTKEQFQTKVNEFKDGKCALF